MILTKPNNLKVKAFVNSNYATNVDNRKSVTGYITTVGGCVVNWVSKMQPSVCLSSTEAEYVAASMCATEVKYVQMIIEGMIKLENTRPATMYKDNTGAIFLMENQANGNRTKHIDVPWHHLREMINEGRLKVHFVKSGDNVADLQTKNLPEEVMVKHRETIRSGSLKNDLLDVDREDVK